MIYMMVMPLFTHLADFSGLPHAARTVELLPHMSDTWIFLMLSSHKGKIKSS